MSRKRKTLIALAVLVAVAIISGVSILAATSVGSQDDPLVTLSYLNNKVKTDVMRELTAAVSDAGGTLGKKFNEQIAKYESESGASSGSASGKADTFTLVTLSKNQSVYCEVGTEIMLRSGSAKAVNGASALVDSTAGTSVADGGTLTQNHMYMVASMSGGVTAADDTVKILVRGSYTVS